MAQPGELPKKSRGPGARRKKLRQAPIKEFMDDKPEASPPTAERDFFRGLARSDFEEDRTPTSSTPVYDALPTPLRVPSKKLDTKSSGRGDGGAELLDLIRKEVIRNNSSIGKDGKFTSSISGKRYMNGGMVMSGRGVRDTKMS